MNNQKEIILLKDLGTKYPTVNSKEKKRFGLYRCFCGNEFESRTSHINSRHTISCGCLKNKTHNLTNHRLFGTWSGMMQRCNNQKNKMYSYYGGRGIKVCDRWNKVADFIEDMYPSYEEGLSIDRIDVNGNYEKSNCRWANKTTQSRNTRLLQSNNKSGYRGVFKSGNKWRTTITVNSKNVSLGYYEDKFKAAKAYDQYIIDNNLEHTRNF